MSRFQLDPTQFAFYPVKPGSGPMRSESDGIEFTGYLTSWQFNSNPQWDSSNDMGRADPKVFYRASQRSLSLTFKVISTTQKEHEMVGNETVSNFAKLKRLGNLTLPIYSSGAGYNGMFVNYSIGTFLEGYGYITGFDMSSGADTPWIRSRPTIIDVSLGITVLTDGRGYVPHWKNGKYSYFGVVQ